MELKVGQIWKHQQRGYYALIVKCGPRRVGFRHRDSKREAWSEGFRQRATDVFTEDLEYIKG